MKVGEIMSSPLKTIPITTTVIEASHIMTVNKIRRLVVTEGEKIAGILSIKDIIKRIFLANVKHIGKGKNIAQTHDLCLKDIMTKIVIKTQF